MGIGLLGLAPFFLFAAALYTYRLWKLWVPNEQLQIYKTRVAKSVLLVIPVMIVLWWHPIVIKTGELLLESDNVSEKYAGLTVLDYLTSDEELQWRSFDVHTRYFGKEVYDSELLRDAFYYINGTRPGIAKKGEGFFGAREWELDRDRGSTSIGKRQEGLTLGESAIDGVVETTEGFGYYEWTMVFDNANMARKEARAAVQLPSYSVVSKVSLWVDGEERDAAFGSTSHVRSVYRNIVAQRRDPLLVTMIGPDQIQMQCFPVPAEGSMKIRLGVTCPLIAGRKLQLPRFIETNFDIPDKLEHHIWIEGDAPVRVSVAGNSEDDSSIVLAMSNDELSRLDTYFEFDVKPPSVYEFSKGALTLEQSPVEKTVIPPVLLLDGREDVFSELAEIEWSADTYSAVVVAQPFGFTTWDGKEDLAKFMNNLSTYGGVNPSPALVESIRLAGSEGAPIVWLHGSLPPAVRDELALEQILRRTDSPIKVTTVAVSGGLNSLVSDIIYMRYFLPHAATGDTKQDLIDATESASQQHVVSAEQVPLGGRPGSGFVFSAIDSMEVSHPYRLFLYSQIMQSWYDRGKVDDDLTALALATRIVTPVSGAVVLENQDQYDRANLDPSVGAENIPKIPEPEFYILLGLALLVMTVCFWRRRLAVC
jgi:hypothetical protein